MTAGYFGGAVDTLLARADGRDPLVPVPALRDRAGLARRPEPDGGDRGHRRSSAGPPSAASCAGRRCRSRRASTSRRPGRSAPSDLRIMFVDIFPNLLAPVLVYLTLLIPAAIAFEATLSFLGLGVVPPTASWGNMLAESLGFYQVAWWFELLPRRLPAGHDAGVQPARRQRPRRARPARRAAVQRAGRGMIRFLVRADPSLGAVVLWVITSGGVRDVLRRAAQRRARDRRPPGHARHGRGRHAPPRARTGRSSTSTAATCGTCCTATSATRTTTPTPVRSLLGSACRCRSRSRSAAAVLWLLLGVASGVLAAVRPRSLDRRGREHRRRCSSTRCRRSCSALILLFFLFFRLHLAGIAFFPGSGYVAAHAEPGRVGAAPDPAVADGGAGHRRHLHPADALVDARRARRGLHPHRARQGPARAAGHLPARAAQRADPGGDAVRHRRRGRCSAA